MVDIPTLDIEDYDPELNEEEETVEDKSGGALTFAIVGAGQGGGRMAKAFYDMGYTKTVAVNTARSDLNGLDIPDNQKFLIDEHAAQGAGKDQAKAQAASELSGALSGRAAALDRSTVALLGLPFPRDHTALAVVVGRRCSDRRSGESRAPTRDPRPGVDRRPLGRIPDRNGLAGSRALRRDASLPDGPGGIVSADRRERRLPADGGRRSAGHPLPLKAASSWGFDADSGSIVKYGPGIHNLSGGLRQ